MLLQSGCRAHLCSSGCLPPAAGSGRLAHPANLQQASPLLHSGQWWCGGLLLLLLWCVLLQSRLHGARLWRSIGLLLTLLLPLLPSRRWLGGWSWITVGTRVTDNQITYCWRLRSHSFMVRQLPTCFRLQLLLLLPLLWLLLSRQQLCGPHRCCNGLPHSRWGLRWACVSVCSEAGRCADRW